ncbi:two-partner secretion domain-containing protein [Nostoc favosum]|uniref:Filamentous hemagglutinin N-terminal domain-containing protein n=1 Tax=Nostoc favosum CHAB5714 TaxID=2780399 RepID=A0ABS8II12_9NOSO|nr:filamentous hemagglutinin N-terminal domain-containing protein [Nostoc favosum]MCC5603768.1 filamentous hemagglutinin N-terminal domain-containing protein [Nostoc favosum CHAB5714]
MKRYRQHWCWKLALGSWLVMSSAIGEAVLQTFALSFNSAFAQITPDSTLTNNSSVTTQNNISTIEGGTQAGSNLFHSFQEFTVPTGGTAFFNNAADIQNIISRVTGGSASNIDGLIRANGTANLFLINPNGIVFGQNAQLNIGGSFIGTTANALQFGNIGFFSATDKNIPSPLLTINPSALLFNQINQNAAIQNNSVTPSGLNPSSEITARGFLRVLDGKSLLLLGGDINMDGGGLLAFGGRVELGGLAGTGTVGLNGDDNNLSLSFPNSVERSNVFLSNGAGVAVTADDGGSIAINARNLEMTGESGLFAGIATGLGSDNSKAGNIEINATGVINLDNDSLISNQVGREANGQAGDINLSANTLQVESGAQVNAGTRGVGKGGNLTVNAQEVRLIGGDSQFVTGLFGLAQPNSTGDAGDLTIRSNTLLVRDGAQVSADTFGTGKGGNLTIKTNTLQVRDGAQVSADTLGTGKGGNLSVDAQDVQLIGGDSQFFTGLSASAQPNSTGDAGDLTIKTNTLLVKDRAEVSANTFGTGKGGNLTIKTNTLQVRDGAQVSADTFGEGKGGNLSVDAQDVQLIGGNSQFFTNLSASAHSTGDAGDLTIKTNTLLVQDRAQVGTDTFGAGKGGNLSVDAQDVQLIRGDSQFVTGLSATAQPNSTGDAGDLTVKTNTLLVRDGAQVNAGSFGEGNGGNLTVTASLAINLIGRRSRLSAQTEGSGASGNVQIYTKQLTVQDGAQISASSLAQGQGGSLFVNASESVELIGKSPDSSQVASGLLAQAEGAGAAGNLVITTGKLIVRDGARVSTTTFAQGQGGNLIVNASGSVELIGGGGLSTQAQGDGVAGNLAITTGKLIVRDGSQVLTTTYGQGQGGILSVNASDSVELIGRDSGLFADTKGDGTAGNLTITTGKLIVQDEAQVFTGTTGKGQGGNLIVNALESVEINSYSSADSSRFSGLLTLTQGAGAAGDLTITTDQLTVKNKSQVAVSSEGTGKAGNLNVTAPSILLDGNQAALNAQTASGNGGNITLRDLNLLLLRRGAQISTTAGTAQAGGNGGNITINAPSGFIVAVPSENSDITANAYTGSGGRVDIQAFGIYGIQPRSNPTSLSDITASSEFGVNGTVEINTPDVDPNSGLVNLPTVPVDTQVAQTCQAGGNLAKSSFTITGRGGLPPNPGEALSADAVQVDLVTLNPEVGKPSTPAVSTNPTSPTPARIVEATGWVITANGDVILTSSAPTVTPHSSWQRTADCRVFNKHQGG